MRPIFLIASLALLAAPALTQNRNYELEWLRNAGARFTGVDAYDLAGSSVGSAGDVNNDGFDDIIFGAPEDPNLSPSNVGGKAYLFYGGTDLDGTFSMSSADVAFDGDSSGAEAGWWVAGGGDFNNDTFDDLLIGSRTADTGGGLDAGKVFLVYGSATLPATIDLGTLGTAGVTFLGEDTSDRTGSSCAFVGDVNNDGFDDIVMGANSADPSLSQQGRCYLIYGRASLTGNFDLATMTGTDGMVMDGIEASDKAGGIVAAAGNINNDLYDDFIITAEQANPGGANNAGQAYVIYGSNSLPASLGLASADLIINGQSGGDFFGTWTSGAGDVDNDGFDDIIVSSDRWPAGSNNAGRSYLIYGADRPSGTTISVVSLGSDGVVFTGIGSGDNSGTAVATGGDMNKDGFADILITASNADSNGVNTGDTYCIYGSSSLPASVSLSAIDATGVVFNGIAAQDRSGASVSFAGDVDGDGWDDMLIGAPRADGGGDTDAGEAYLVKGANHYFWADGPVAEGGTFEYRAQGRPSTAFLAFLSLDRFTSPLITGAGPWWLKDPILELFILSIGSNGAMAVSLPVPVSTPSAVGLTVHMQNFQDPLYLGADTSYVLTFTIE